MSAFDSAAFDPAAFDAGAASGALNPVGTSGTQANTGSGGAIGQEQNLAGSGGAQGNQGDAGALSQAQNLTGAASEQTNTGDSAAVGIVVQGELAGTAGEQGNSGSSGAITQAQNLAGSSGSQANEGSAGAVTSNVDPRYARPAQDVLRTGGSWTPSSGTSLADMLAEPSADAGTFIQASTPGLCEVALNPVQDPGTDEGHVMRYQAWSDTGDGLTVRLMQGEVEIAAWTHASLPAVPTIFAQRLSVQQAAKITNYSELLHQFEAL